MNPKLAQQIKQTLGSDSHLLPKRVQALLDLVSTTYDNYEYKYESTRSTLDSISQEYKLTSSEFQQNVTYQESILNNLKKAIISINERASFYQSRRASRRPLNCVYDSA